MQPNQAEELARARLAFVSAGLPPLSAPRRAAPEADADDALPANAVPDGGAESVEPLTRPATTPAPWSMPAVTARHVAVVVVLLLCAVGVGFAALGRSAATEIPVAPVVVTSTPPPSPSAPPTVRVHVAGAVARPGVVRVPAASIVQDALLAAGGLTPEADAALLNLAAPVADGMQIVVGTGDEPMGEIREGDGGEGGSTSELDLNSATAAELESLPGIGPVTAASIVAWREEHGRFTSVAELQEVSGIGPKTFEKLAPLVRVG